MIVLEHSGLSDLIGVFSRVILENCILGLTVLFREQEGVTLVWGEYQRQAALWAVRNDQTALLDVIDPDARNASRVNIEQLASELGPILIHEEPHSTGSASFKGLYDAAFRGHSFLDVHGAGTVVRYLVMSDTDPWRIVVRPRIDASWAPGNIIMAVTYALHFAQHAVSKWGYDNTEVVHLLQEVVMYAEQHAPPHR